MPRGQVVARAESDGEQWTKHLAEFTYAMLTLAPCILAAEQPDTLRELLPPKEHTYFRLGAQDMQRVLLRTSCLDLYLQSNLFIQ